MAWATRIPGAIASANAGSGIPRRRQAIQAPTPPRAMAPQMPGPAAAGHPALLADPAADDDAGDDAQRVGPHGQRAQVPDAPGGAGDRRQRRHAGAPGRRRTPAASSAASAPTAA